MQKRELLCGQYSVGVRGRNGYENRSRNSGFSIAVSGRSRRRKVSYSIPSDNNLELVRLCSSSGACAPPRVRSPQVHYNALRSVKIESSTNRWMTWPCHRQPIYSWIVNKTRWCFFLPFRAQKQRVSNFFAGRNSFRTQRKKVSKRVILWTIKLFT